VNVSSSPVKTQRKDRSQPRSAQDLVHAVQRRCFRRAIDTPLLQDVLQLIREAVRFDSATLYLIDDSGNWNELVSIGRAVEPLDFLPLGSGTGLSGWAAYTGKPMLLKDRTRSRHFNPETDIASFLSTPIPQTERPIAVLNLGGDRPELFTEKHLEVLELVSVMLAPILERAACERQLSDLNQQLAETQTELAQAESRIAAGGAAAMAGAMISHVHEINEQLAIIVGNIDCLLAEPLQGNQGALTRLQRAEEAAMRLRTCGRKLLRLTQPRKQTAKSTA
jgi:GAF domain-containing protein